MGSQTMSGTAAPERTPARRRAGAFANTRDLPMQSCPIDPAWIRAGEPQSRAALHSRAVDGLACTNLWECTSGTFQWYYGWEETVVILEGKVQVTSADGRTHALRAGDIAYFPANTTWLWEVDGYVRKVAFCRRQVPFMLRFATRALARLNLASRLGEAGGAALAALRRLATRAGLRDTSALTLLMTLPL
ncbi:cupin domain-containing protein [Cupriavidus sp. WS]|uniref:cupin domain-containing protein n=1 Tax=Cupriavidus sp. WS TaxID=1312922 RepID=UPI0003A42E34|nr:cupin domain-containing protein [Cupriavidus sp. WS]